MAKRKDSRYESGKRRGSWAKYRLNHGQELVIGGYVPGSHGLDSIIVGYYRGKELVYIARVRNGFVPATRRQVFEKLRPLQEPKCPFVNLPEAHKGRWGDGLTAGIWRNVFGYGLSLSLRSNSWSGLRAITYVTQNLSDFGTIRTHGQSSRNMQARLDTGPKKMNFSW